MFNEKKLHEFLTEHETEILQLCREKVLANSDAKPTSELLDRGLPIFYKEVIAVLERTAHAPKDADLSKNMITEGSATEHGKESLRLGYSISQVVHAYGAVCQSITEFVQTKSFKIQSIEFHDFNLALDCAIAEAVTEYEKAQSENTNRVEAERMGFLIHELGNSLAAASISHEMIQTGHVGSAGVTSKVLSRALDRMRGLINSSLTEVRLRGHAKLKPSNILLTNITDEIVPTAQIVAKSKEIHLELAVDPALEVTADRNLLFSALSNLVSNAMKFTREKGNVTIRAKESGEHILIEVEDECGGLPGGDVVEIFKPFIQTGTDNTGMGLGLSLSREAIKLNNGTLTASNIPGKGCIFTIDLPASREAVETAA